MKLIKTAKNRVVKPRIKIKPKVKINYIDKDIVRGFLFGIGFEDKDLTTLLNNNHVLKLSTRGIDFKIVFEGIIVERKNSKLDIKYENDR